ncbi:serine/threonine-protein kinase, partial [Georgenia ruanii]|uniref:serine/threonine-protein kinase n=1 Tax=Georgenia ruanii TaxID=348442 RepID=UPI0031E30A6A
MRPRSGLVLGGRYELTERIAVGGMGEVWQARDRRLGATVAAKVLRAELVGNDLFLNRLRTEARNSAGLRHPNLAALLDHGEQEGSGYLVMELVPGETLADRLEREATIAPAELLPILIQACHGLHAVHTSGVVHRDVKPANLIITPQGQVKLTDFGISLGANQAPMTAAGMVMGTAQYLPPEQAMGKAATAAGDVYALGVVAYECLVGHRPYTGATQVDIAFAHVNTPLPALPASVPAPVRAVVERMLAKDPAARPASARACATELEEARTGLAPVSRRALRAQPRARHVLDDPTATPAAPAPAPGVGPGPAPAARRGSTPEPITPAPAAPAPAVPAPTAMPPAFAPVAARRRAGAQAAVPAPAAAVPPVSPVRPLSPAPARVVPPAPRP